MQRLVSLDVLRGLTVIGMILVNSAAYVHYVNGFPAYPALMHSEWAGLTLADWVFPAFLFMVGVSIPMAAQGRPQSAGKILARAGRLILVGLLLTNMYWLADMDAYAFRPFGVLQRIGLVYGAAALLFMTTGWRTRLGIAGLILILYWPLCLIPSPDGTATDIWARGYNFVAWFDRAVLGSHAYVKGAAGYDPEGVLSTLPAIAQGLIGCLVGEWLLKQPKRTGALAAGGAVMTVAGLAWGLVFPVVKDIWTSSYVLLTSGLTLLVLAALHVRLDGREIGRGWSIATAFGVNAIAAYVLHYLASVVLAADAMKLPYDWTLPVLGGPAAALVPVLIFLALNWAAMAWLQREGWVVKI
ncbi:heparan-alpha-glucosaminide N-acetyltransferase domain-containing protein [Caulobacter segnis]|uniref:acyltransferase family protein n=1 Tax=Caulobacter segnis TaxID=88688 RepID=UPI00240EA4AF|nr:heparan-alpha-glucosaminide N-acetyltransferase domain-containing protein [Caulobacter segnis]MDG2523539.1 heparan-alpha-glucosaminide N-acetyltransferase domain-containing protein [Caulobacter segnis]